MPFNGKKETTGKSNYQKEIVSEANDIKELPEVTFPINLKFIQKYQQAEPSIRCKYKTCTYHKGSFNGGYNIDLKHITREDNIFIPSKLQSYILYWYRKYLLHPSMDITEAMICQHSY